MTNKIDLHIHSTASDGTEHPKDILKIALKKQLEYISLTDHESIEGYQELLEIRNTWQNRLNIIPGVELHTYYKNIEIHLLGYGIDINNLALINKLEEIRRERTELSLFTVKKLQDIGVKIQWESIINLASKDVAITKAHVIGAIKQENINMDKSILFNYFHPQGQYYLPYKNHSLEDAISLIENANGVAVLAHPGLLKDDGLVEEIIAKFNIGLEVYYHYFGEKAQIWIEAYKKLAEKYNVLISGGSDYHGAITPVEIGDTFVPENMILPLTKKCL